tara:strand:- start:2619 stop:2846 length:228 start_codon:yes stop_codon:yes gene_type:complete
MFKRGFLLTLASVFLILIVSTLASAAITERLEFLGEFSLNSGTNTVFMNTAAQCPPDQGANSVKLDKLCIVPVVE